MKVAVIGLEGADPSLVFDELADAMPNLAELAEDGVSGPLASTHPPEPIPAWTSFLTGQNPGELGLTGETNRDWTITRQGRQAPYGEGARVGSLALDEATVWERAGEAGCDLALVGLPHTFPVEPVDGTVVAGSPAPGPDAAVTHPPELGEELALGEAFFTEPPAEADRQSKLDRARAALAQRFDVAEHLAERSWDLFAMVARSPRLVQETAWSTHDTEHALHEDDTGDAVRAHHRRLDERIGDLVETLPDDTAIVVASVQGAQACQGTVQLNAWLRREGYLSLADEPEAPTAFDAERVDWANTQAWAAGGAAGHIHLNVAGREPQGTVPPLDYEALRDELQAELAAIDAGDGHLAAQAIAPGEVHEGARVDEGPDLFVYVEELAYRCEASLGHETVLTDPARGRHEATASSEGLIVVSDPGDRFSGTVDDMQATDGAATLLDLLGLDVPEKLEGRVLQPDGSLPG